MEAPKIRLPRWRRDGGLSGWQRVALVVGLAVVLLAAMSVAAAARVGASSGRILAGVQVGGVDVGGMTRAEAVAAVKATTEPKLRRGVVVVGGDKRWPVTPAGLGRGAGVEAAVEGGFGFCDVVLGWDSNDQLFDNVKYTGWHTAYPDAWVRVIPETCREIPFEDNTLFFLCEFVNKAEEICPRGVLRRVLDRAAKMGYEAYSSAEYEFFMFDETPESVREKGFRNLTPMTPGYFGYSMIRGSVWAELYHEILDTCETMRMPIEGLHTETGPGVLEAALAFNKALESADRAALFKTFMKVLAQRREPPRPPIMIAGAFEQKPRTAGTQVAQAHRADLLIEGDRGRNPCKLASVFEQL